MTERRFERWHQLRDVVPDTVVADAVIAVSDAIAHADDAAGMGNLGGKRSITTKSPIERFAGDFQSTR